MNQFILHTTAHQPWVNVAPGMTETSTFPIGLHAAGLDFGEVCRDLAAAAATRG